MFPFVHFNSYDMCICMLHLGTENKSDFAVSIYNALEDQQVQFQSYLWRHVENVLIFVGGDI